MKNVVAIAAGTVHGLGYGSNTRAALICRGLVDMTRLAERMGSDASCMKGLAGIVDSLLTCSPELFKKLHSNSSSCGRRDSVEDTELKRICSGRRATTKALRDLRTKLYVPIPLCEEVL